MHSPQALLDTPAASSPAHLPALLHIPLICRRDTSHAHERRARPAAARTGTHACSSRLSACSPSSSCTSTRERELAVHMHTCEPTAGVCRAYQGAAVFACASLDGAADPLAARCSRPIAGARRMVAPHAQMPRRSALHHEVLTARLQDPSPASTLSCRAGSR
jgi:hypothetical protein